jgi:hypothetical protein
MLKFDKAVPHTLEFGRELGRNFEPFEHLVQQVFRCENSRHVDEALVVSIAFSRL